MSTRFFQSGLVALLLIGLCLGWTLPAEAAEDLIDVVEITGTDPIIVEGNILPGDTFTRTLTVKNLTSVAQDIAVKFDLDAEGQIVRFSGFELENVLAVKIKNLTTNTVVILPGTGKLSDLDGAEVVLGSLPGSATYQYEIQVEFDINAGNEYQKTQVKFNLTLGVVVIDNSPGLLLNKFNDSITDEVPGNEVVYTLEVTALGGPVDDVTVTDLPPEGFVYVPGSGTGAPFVHEYASPGIWDLGDMAEGETKTLTYKTKISATQDAGLYDDLAFAKGVAGTDTIFANAPNTPFVGTDVNVILPTNNPLVALDQERKEETEKKTKTRYVLGAATGLPLTGTPIKLVLFIVGGGAAGLVIRRWARQQLAKLGLVMWLVLGSSILIPSALQAATNLSLRIETPASVVATPDFKIGFVALDTLTRDITVRCYTTLSATPFATYALASAFGGNAGDCEVDGSVMPSDGTYEFYATATASSEGDETIESDHVTVTLATGAPGTPLNYDRGDPGCDNVITFTTADDGGKTVAVELYRSANNPFVADDTTKVAEQAIGSNTSGSFTVPAPGCDDDVFYALRAIDAFGRGSGFVGDREVDTKTITKTTTKTVTVPGQNTATGAIPAPSTGTAVAANPAVEGVSTEGEEGNAVGEEGDDSQQVLGDMTEEETAWLTRYPWLMGLLGLLAFGIGFFGYRRFLNRHKHDDSLS